MRWRLQWGAPEGDGPVHPDDISVVGFDDSPMLAEFLDPP